MSFRFLITEFFVTRHGTQVTAIGQLLPFGIYSRTWLVRYSEVRSRPARSWVHVMITSFAKTTATVVVSIRDFPPLSLMTRISIVARRCCAARPLRARNVSAYSFETDAMRPSSLAGQPWTPLAP